MDTFAHRRAPDNCVSAAALEAAVAAAIDDALENPGTEQIISVQPELSLRVIALDFVKGRGLPFLCVESPSLGRAYLVEQAKLVAARIAPDTPACARALRLPLRDGEWWGLVGEPEMQIVAVLRFRDTRLTEPS